MDTDLFDYYLPEELIAQKPADKRDESRLLVVDNVNKTYEDKIFKDIVEYFRPGDVLVRNNTKVFPARLFGVKSKTGAKVEMLMLKEISNDVWECLFGNAKVVKVGTEISFGDGRLVATCLEIKDEGIRIVSFKHEQELFSLLAEIGNTPLPPYIKQRTGDKSRYQTVYASKVGSAAAPTAGFHFTNELLEKLKAKGVEIYDITLHVGLGTFKPVKEKTIEKHKMHTEYFEVSKDTADALNLAKSEGRRIIAVGTTVTRTLEAVMSKYHKFVETKEETNIFIMPGYEFKAIDALITNFHLPKSTLLMLVSALLGREFALQLYKHAVDEKYRFFSYGDAMFIHGK